MSRNILDSTKLAQKRCAEISLDWNPWIHVSEFSSEGTRALTIDWKSGRSVHCMSQVERNAFIIFRWNNDVDFICEQAALNKKKTDRIAESFGIKSANTRDTPMTTDFLLIMKSGKLIAVSVKYDRKVLTSNSSYYVSMRRRLAIEKRYFEEMKVPWILVFNDNINKTLVNNIRIVTEYYDSARVHDRISYIKHLIAHKQLNVDMTSGDINFWKLEGELFND